MRIVMKYGGSSVATLPQIKAIAKRLKEKKEAGDEVVCVVSAMGKTTNELLALSTEICSSPGRKEQDFLLCTGEMRTVSLLCLALVDLGIDAEPLMGFQAGLTTNEVFSRAFIEHISPRRIEHLLGLGKVVVVAGFQGLSWSGRLTTLGRGGSDITAVALAAALGAKCEIFTDVEGVYSVDPKLFAGARKLPLVSYDEMIEMSIAGARVLDARCVGLAKKYGVPIYLGKALGKKGKGTFIMNKQDFFEKMPVTSLAVKQQMAIVSIRFGSGESEMVGRILAQIAGLAINITMINQDRVGKKEIFSFCCTQTEASEIVRCLRSAAWGKKLSIEVRKEMIKLTLVGIGFITHGGIVATALEALSEVGIAPQKINVSDLTCAIMVDKSQMDSAIAAEAKTFKL